MSHNSAVRCDESLRAIRIRLDTTILHGPVKLFLQTLLGSSVLALESF